MNSGVIFFFFKQKTAYEILTCDWSSDVCSSDLGGAATARNGQYKKRAAAALSNGQYKKLGRSRIENRAVNKGGRCRNEKWAL